MGGVDECIRQSRRYQETLGRGIKGEQYLFERLSAGLAGSGLEVRLVATEADHTPFDLEVLDGDRILVGIENKDLRPSTQGTWIKGSAKRRKLEYAAEHRVGLVLTTVTIREAEQVGFHEGLVNGHPTRFDYDFGHLVERIMEAKRGYGTCNCVGCM